MNLRTISRHIGLHFVVAAGLAVSLWPGGSAAAPCCAGAGPGAAVPPRVLGIVRTGTEVRFAFTRTSAAAWEVESSTDLQTWQSVGTAAFAVEGARVTMWQSLAAGEGKRFYRAAVRERVFTPVQSGAWSSAAVWGGAPPTAGARVDIPPGVDVTLDTEVPPLKSVTVQGTLRFARRDQRLAADWIMVHGRLEIGTAAQPFAQRAEIVLTGEDPSEDVACSGMSMGTKFLSVMNGGRLELHGAPKLPWTRLAAHANAGSQTLTLSADPAGWSVGDRIAIAPTDYEPLEAETRTITAIHGRVVTVDVPLAHTHWGTLQTVSGIALDQRAEVANLSRSITIQGDSPQSFGGHIMVMETAAAQLANVELTRMGQLGRKGRYPIHFHLMHDSGAGSFVRNSVIHHTFQRGLVVHQSNDLQIADNVIYDTIGMQYFLEDGVEVRNVFERNLGLLTRKVPNDKSLSSELLDRGDNEPGVERPAAFWITNQHNIFRDNVAVGVIGGWGFAFRASDVLPANRATMPLPANAAELENLPQLEFSGNYVRTIGKSDDQFNLGYGPEEAGSGFRFGGGGGEGPVPILAPTAFKCVNAAFWATSGRPIVGGTFADVRTVVVQDQGVHSSPVVRGAKIVAFSANDPRQVAAEAGDPLDRGPFGQSLFESTEAGDTKFINCQVVGNFPNAAINPEFTAPAPATVTGDFALSYPPEVLLGLTSGVAQTLTVNVVRSGYDGAIDVRLPEYERAEQTSGLTADPLTIPAGAHSGVLTLRPLNTRQPADVAEGSTAKTFPLSLLSTGGGQTKIDSLGVVEMASNYVRSRPGVNIAAGYDTSSPRGLSNMEMNRGVNFAFDGTDQFAHATGTQPWAEIAWDHRQKVRQIRLWQPPSSAVYGNPPAWGDFIVVVSDFALLSEDTPLAEAVALPFVRVFSFPGLAGTKAAPTVLNLPAGTTARSIRVWKRTSTDLTLQEMQVIGD